jgi:hypothetical protein
LEDDPITPAPTSALGSRPLHPMWATRDEKATSYCCDREKWTPLHRPDRGNAATYCALIWTFAFGATLHRVFAGFTFDRFGNVWSTTHESIA